MHMKRMRMISENKLPKTLSIRDKQMLNIFRFSQTPLGSTPRSLLRGRLFLFSIGFQRMSPKLIFTLKQAACFLWPPGTRRIGGNVITLGGPYT